MISSCHYDRFPQRTWNYFMPLKIKHNLYITELLEISFNKVKHGYFCHCFSRCLAAFSPVQVAVMFYSFPPFRPRPPPLELSEGESHTHGRNYICINFLCSCMGGVCGPTPMVILPFVFKQVLEQ